MTEKMLPSNVEAERTLIGLLLWHPEVFALIIDSVTSQDFYRDAHRDIFAVITRLHNRDQSTDVVMVSDILERQGMEQIGDTSTFVYLQDLYYREMDRIEFSPVDQRAQTLARLIAQLAEDREVADACLKGFHKAYEGTGDALACIEAMIQDIRKKRKRDAFLSIGEYYPTYLEHIDKRLGGESIRGIPTDLSDLDFITGGMQCGDLWVPAARPGVGKTTLCQNFAYTAAIKHQKRVGFFSLEMNKDALMDRFVAIHTAHIRQPIDSQNLRNAHLSDTDMQLLTGNVMEAFEHLGIYITHTPGITIDALRSMALGLMARHKMDMFVVDYLQLLRATDGNGKRIMPRAEEVAEIARQLKILAGELNVPILAPAQINRQIDTRAAYKREEKEKYTYKMPVLSDLRECVAGSTRLIDAKTGKWKPIIEVQSGDEILAVGAHQKIGRFTVQDMWTTGYKPVFCLTTRTGKQIVATANHPFMTASGWKRLNELHAGDCIASAMNITEYGQEMPERADLCRFLGYMVGDGTYQKHREVAFISSDLETLEDAIQIVAKHYPTIQSKRKPNVKTPEVKFSSLYENGYGKPYGNPLREWFRSLEMFGQKDTTKRVPGWVFEAGTVGAREFLAGYLSSDGCVKRSIKREHITWEIHFDTVSRWLANDIQALLLRIGVIASINDGYTSKKATQPLYRINVSVESSNLKRFAEQVPARGKKGRLLQQLLGELPKGQTNSGLFGLPQEVSTYLAQDTTWRDQGKKMNRSVCLEWAEKLDDPTLHEWAESDLLWEEIRSIETFGEQMVFDVSIPGCHNFIADGIIAHNSGEIEQSADVVMFLARSEEKEERVRLYVAKHRMGETGGIDLYFVGSETRFYPISEIREE